MAEINYLSKLVRVFEEKNKSEKITSEYFAEVQVRSPEPNIDGMVYTYTLRLPINREQFGDLEDKLKNEKRAISFDLTLKL